MRIESRPAPSARHDAGLRSCLNAWLAARPLPPLHFLTEPDTLDGPLADRLLYVALLHGAPIAFLLASPVPGRNGYLFEEIARCPSRAPNGTAELLIDTAMRDLATRGASLASLGLVALSTHAPLDRNPPWLRALFSYARAHGRRFYHFDGLEHFRAKMRPDSWEPLYVISNHPRFTPAALYSAAAAFCHGSPLSYLARALTRDAHEIFSRAVASLSL